MTKTTINRQKLNKLQKTLEDSKTLLIVMQDYPDPDAIAAASALRQIANAMAGSSCTLTYSGGIGRSENQALARYVGLNLRLIDELNPENYDRIAMVDTQPGTGNNALDIDICPHIVIDHHPIRHATRSVPFTDIRRRYGATATILYEYLVEADLKIEVNLATALVYGIRSDTQDLGREATQADINAYLALYPSANKRMLSRIEHTTVPRAYFQVIAAGLTRATMYGPAIISHLGTVDHPDVMGEVADLLLRNEESCLALVHGVHKSRLLLSLRTSGDTTDAGRLIQKIVGRQGTGGGHSSIAGGQIPLEDESNKTLSAHLKRIRDRFLKAARCGTEKGEPLVDVSLSPS